MIKSKHCSNTMALKMEENPRTTTAATASVEEEHRLHRQKSSRKLVTERKLVDYTLTRADVEKGCKSHHDEVSSSAEEQQLLNNNNNSSSSTRPLEIPAFRSLYVEQEEKQSSSNSVVEFCLKIPAEMNRRRSNESDPPVLSQDKEVSKYYMARVPGRTVSASSTLTRGGGSRLLDWRHQGASKKASSSSNPNSRNASPKSARAA
mmetsp:Transcript_17536/g.40755  ORF Transcript_17536/g.40755 Transcript_17536/m.40755 type:complete len:205 (-) Transcript_17536:111-725(-)